jgi:hypothetical protein
MMAPRMTGINNVVMAPLTFGTGIDPRPTTCSAITIAPKMAASTIVRVSTVQGFAVFVMWALLV